MLLLGGISMHVFIGPALFRPVSDNMRFCGKEDEMKPIKAVDGNYSSLLDETSFIEECDASKSEREVQPRKKSKNSILHWALLKDSWFLTFLLSLFFFNLGLLSMIFIVPLCLENGYSKSEVLLVLSLYGIADMIGSLLLGLVLDTNLMSSRSRRYHVCYVLYILMGVTSSAMGFFNSFTLFITVIVCRGLSVSVYSIRIPVLSDVVGDDKLASGIAISSPVIGLGTFLGPLVGGKINTKPK